MKILRMVVCAVILTATFSVAQNQAEKPKANTPAAQTATPEKRPLDALPYSPAWT